MGMFDTITINLILPGNTVITKEPFQTKSFECLMHNYVVTANGQLYRDYWDYEWIDDPTHFLGGYENRIEGSNQHIYLTDFSREVIFHTSRPTWSNTWRDYHAQFVNGKLSKMWFNDKQY